MLGYYFGAFEVVNGTLSPADMMTFVSESQVRRFRRRRRRRIPIKLSS
jgi:hypothetical protein